MKNLEEYFLHLHNNPPASFNPDYDPKAKSRSKQVCNSMEEDAYYNNHTREECKQEWRRRYDVLKHQDKIEG